MRQFKEKCLGERGDDKEEKISVDGKGLLL